MKNIKIVILIAALLALIMAVGCELEDGGFEFEGESGQISGDGEIKINTEPLYGLADYYIIRSDLASDVERDAMMKLKNSIKNGLDIDLAPSTDWIGGDQVEHEKEIIIGDTQRAASRAALKGLSFGDFVIKRIGEKIVIAGGSDSATAKAVDFFIAHFINVYGGCLDIPVGDGYIYEHEYMFDSLTIDGEDISEFSLYAYPEVDISGVSEYIAENVYGVVLPVAQEKTDSGKYIIFDNSGLIANGFSIELKYDGNLYVTGSVNTAQYAVEYFKKDFFKALEKKSSNCNIAIQDNYVGNSGETPDHMTASEIVSRLEEYSASDKFLAGEQGGSYGTPGYVAENFKSAVGKAPDILALDLFGYGLHVDELDQRELSEIICQIADYAQQGGIIAISAYFENSTGGWSLGDRATGSLGSKENWESLVTDGTDLNKKFRRQLDSAALFLKALSDNGITAIFKPFESHNTDKYWYGTESKGASPESFIELWKYVYKYLSIKGCTSLIWQYSPYVTDGAKGLFDAYPGDEYTDLVGGVWQEVGVRGVSAEFSSGMAAKGKGAGVITLSVSKSKISNAKDGQLALFNCRDLADAVRAQKAKGEKIPAFVTFGVSSAPAWLGEGSALAE